MVFEDIVGQSNAINNIKNAVKNDRIAHAYLFSGPDGVGKSIAAMILASVLNCQEKGVNPCGKCLSCIKAQDGNHPDIISFSTNKQSISIDDIRELQKDMQKKPYEKGVKVYIIHKAGTMTQEAQNSLLKTLEEPPGHIVIILLAEDRYSLLGTIISRCQVINFSRAPEKDIQGYLEAKLGIKVEEAKFLAAFSGGILGKALKYVQDENSKKVRDEVINISRNIFRSDKLKALSYADYFLTNKDKIFIILDIMLSWFRDIIVMKECTADEYIINLDKKDIILDECSKYDYTNLDNIIKYIGSTAENIKSNTNYQLTIEMMLLNIQEG